MKRDYSNILQYFILLLLIYLIIFVKLDYFHMRNWDESMFAVNAYEMLHNHKYFSYYYEGHPDLLNTKPPLIIWFQILFIKLIGFNEMAIRLPSALAAGLCIMVVFSFADKHYGRTAGWLSALTLLTSQGFIYFHSGRGGEADELLALFTLMAGIQLINYSITGKNKYILYTFIFVTLATCTKLYAGLLFSPAYVIILMLHKRLRSFVTSWHFVTGFLIFVFTTTTIIYLRELDTPGYLREITHKDVIRIGVPIEDHAHAWNFYLDNLSSWRFTFWFIPLVISALVILIKLKNGDSLQRDILILIVIYLTIISVSVTKLEWYDVPLFPFFALLIGNFLNTVIFSSSVINLDLRKKIALTALLFSYPFWFMFRTTQDCSLPESHKKMELNERYLFLKSLNHENINGLKVFYYRYNGGMLFYKYKFREAGQKIELFTKPDFLTGDRVLLSDDALYNVLASNFKFTIEEEQKSLRVLKILGRVDDRN